MTVNISNLDFIETENMPSYNFLKSPPIIKPIEINIKTWKKYPMFKNYFDDNKYEKRLNSFSKRLFSEEKTGHDPKNFNRVNNKILHPMSGFYNERRLKRTFKSIFYDTL